MRLFNIRINSFRRLVCAALFLTAGVCLAQDRIRVSDSEGKKAATNTVAPSYPPMAKQMKISGHVEVDVEVSPDGGVEKVDVVSGNTLLAGACVSAVKQWKFTPFQAGGKPTAAVVRLGFNFNL